MHSSGTKVYLFFYQVLISPSTTCSLIIIFFQINQSDLRTSLQFMSS